MAKIIDTRHPEYDLCGYWAKWRRSYEAGTDFINTYLYKLSDRESDTELTTRKSIAYVPAFATAAVNDIKNSIFQRISDVRRNGGPESYQTATKGIGGGVDLQGNSMGSFIGTAVLPELLPMGKVGIIVDNFDDLGITLADKGSKRPYIDVFATEDILSWSPRRPVNGYTHVLLRELVDTIDSYGLPDGTEYRYRLYTKVLGGVTVEFFDANGDPTDSKFLSIDKIPFVLLQLPHSLMMHAADYQIALMNLESSDIAFARKANFPFYYEFFDPKTEPLHAKSPALVAGETPKQKEINVGLTQGRRFPQGLEAPGFINPDPETLKVSMEKGFQLKEDIRLIVNLNLVNMNPRRQAAESKEMDSRGLESGLSFIGLILEKAENEIADLWRKFEGEGDVANIKYPKNYSLKTDEQRREEAKKLEELMNKIPSTSYRKAVARKIARLMVSMDVTDEEMEKIIDEINNAKTLVVDPDIIFQAHEQGLSDDKTASEAIGFDPTIVEQAKKDRAERIKLTLEAQGGVENGAAARGTPEFATAGKTSSEEKEGKPKRGEAK